MARAKKIVVVGGGISGLAAAHRLTELASSQRESLEVTLLEESSRLGGILQTTCRDGFLIERGPDSFISEKPEAIDLARRLGIDSRLIQTNSFNRRSFIVRGGKLRPVPEGFQLLAPTRIWPFVTTDIFSVTGKLRMAMDLVLARRKSNGIETDDESLASFVRRRLGQEALERMAQPMVGGIYTANPETLSLRATLPRFLDMEREHRSIILSMWRRRRVSTKESSGVSGARYSLFLSFDKGMQVLADALKEKLGKMEAAAGLDIRLNTKVKGLRFRQGSESDSPWKLSLADGSTVDADGICLAVPAYVAAQLLESTSPSLASALLKIRYASTATVNLAYPRANIAHPLDGFGFVVPFVEKRSLIACTFSSIKFPGRAPDNLVLLRAFVGGDLQPEMFELDNDKMVHQVTRDLDSLLSIRGVPLFTEIAKWTKSMPQYAVGHLHRVSQIEDEANKLASLTLAGNAYRGAGIPDCIRSGEHAAQKLLA